MVAPYSEVPLCGNNLSENLDDPLDPMATTRCNLLLEVLKGKPQLDNFAKRLSIRGSTHRSGTSEKDLRWLQVCTDELIEILGMLGNVKWISFRRVRKDILDFSLLPSSLRVALHSFFFRKGITHADICGIRNIELTPLVQHPSLVRLLLEGTSPSSAEVDAFLPLNAPSERTIEDNADAVPVGLKEKTILQRLLFYATPFLCGSTYFLCPLSIS